MIVDDISSDMSSRYESREKLDEVLGRPLDEAKAEEYDRDNWGTSREARLEAAKKDTLWGDLTHG